MSKNKTTQISKTNVPQHFIIVHCYVHIITHSGMGDIDRSLAFGVVAPAGAF